MSLKTLLEELEELDVWGRTDEKITLGGTA